MKGKIFGLLTFALMLVLCAGFASAIVNEDSIVVKLDEDVLSETSDNFVVGLEKGDEFEVKVQLRHDCPAGQTSCENLRDVQVSAEIRGYDHDDRMEDITDTFDMKPGVTYTKKLTLQLKDRMDQDQYKLRIQIEDRDSPTVEKTYEIEVDGKRHLLYIKDVALSPEDEVKAGRNLIAKVRIANRGEKDEEGVKVKVSIPELGLAESDYVDELEKEGADDDEITTEEFVLRIPECADAGQYTLKVEATYDDGDEKETYTQEITVVNGDYCTVKAESESEPNKVDIQAGPAVQELSVNGAAMYMVGLTNKNGQSKAYTIQVNTPEGISAQVTPSNVFVVSPGETETAYIKVSADENAAPGENYFSVVVKLEDVVLKEIPLKVNVAGKEAASGGLKRALETGLVVLVVLLIIIGLVIGFSKLRSDDDEDDSETQTYY